MWVVLNIFHTLFLPDISHTHSFQLGPEKRCVLIKTSPNELSIKHLVGNTSQLLEKEKKSSHLRKAIACVRKIDRKMAERSSSWNEGMMTHAWLWLCKRIENRWNRHAPTRDSLVSFGLFFWQFLCKENPAFRFTWAFPATELPSLRVTFSYIRLII